MATLIRISNLTDWLQSLEQARANVSDLTEPLTDIAKSWMKSNAIYFQQAPGIYKDLRGTQPGRHPLSGRFQSVNGGYKGQKKKQWGFVYPILKASGTLERSLTVFGDPGNLFEILNGTRLVLGTRVVSKNGDNYPNFLHKGFTARDGSKVEARPFLQIPELSIAGWKKTLRDYIIKCFGPPGRAVPALRKSGSGGGKGQGSVSNTSASQGGTTGKSSQVSREVRNTQLPSPISRGGGGGGAAGSGSAKKKKKKV